MTLSCKRIGALICGLLLVLPIAVQVLTIRVFNQNGSYPDKVNLFKSYFPQFFREPSRLNLLSFGLCVVAAVLSVRNHNDANVMWKAVSWLFFVAGILLALLNLFQIM